MEEHAQQFGTRSTFGPQVPSKRATSPTAKFGAGGRTNKVHEAAFETQLLGRTSPGPTTAICSAFGKQAHSKSSTAPAYGVPKAASTKAVKSTLGPGAYGVPTDTIGVQPTESGCAKSPAYKIGTSSRWAEGNGGPTGEPVDPLLHNPRPASGYLGDAPCWSFHGPQHRNLLATTGDGCPLAPTAVTSPGPGAYKTETSSFGTQVNSEAISNSSPKVPKGSRDALMKQALPRNQEYVLLGRASPGPGITGQYSSMGKQLLSRAKSSGPKFGTSDRFSDFKPRAVKGANSSGSNDGSESGAKTNKYTHDKRGKAYTESPGPGSYVKV